MKQELKLFRRTFLITIAIAISSVAIAQAVDKKETKKPSLKEYAGEYTYDNKSDFGFDVTISYDEEIGLQAQPTDKSQPQAGLMAVEKDHFEQLQTGGLFATFKRNDKGKIISLAMSNGDRSFTCIRKE